MEAPIYLTLIEEARIEADALAGAFEDHRATMHRGSRADLIRELQLHRAASAAARIVGLLEDVAARKNQAAAS